MQEITLRDYFKIKGWEGKRGKKMEFAEKCGVSPAYISKLYNCLFMSVKNNGKFENVAAAVAFDGYKLVRGNPIELGMNGIIKENDSLKKEVNDLKMRNSLLEQEIADLKDFLRIAKRIAEEDKKQIRIKKGKS